MKNIKHTKQWVIGMIALSIMIISTAPATGQDAVEASAGVDLVSKYVWRGVTQGTGASIQPALGLSYKGFSLGAWGSVSIANPDPYEFDLSLGYSIGGFSIGITDYYWNGSEGSFFDYYADNHLFEGNLAFTFGEKFPLTLSWNTFFAGDDKNEEEKQQFSTYIEAAYDFSLGGLDFTASIGAAPWNSNAWLDTEIYKSGFQISAISLTGSKKLEITPTFSVPLFVQCIFSPATDASHLVVGFSF
jgi:uncharacterized protein (TIGR02001 family)